MKKLVTMFFSLCLLLTLAVAEMPETVIVLGDEITVNGAAVTEDTAQPVYLAHVVEKHDDVPAELKNLSNRVLTITEGGAYRLSGTATDVQLAVRAGAEDDVRLILDGVDITCRTSSAIAVYSARDPKMAGEYGVTIELAEGSDNRITGSHTVRVEETDTKLDGAVCSLVSLGFEGTGKIAVDADNEGVEVKFGHLTVNGGVFHIESGDDPLNVSEDGVGVLTMNDGYVYSAVKNAAGGEGDGIDSNGWIIFNGGTAINLAHPGSMDGGIDSDMGSSINGGLIVGAGNMYDPIEADSAQLFMMLEFTEATDDLLVVTDAAGTPVFAYDFPYSYKYIAFSTPALREGEVYRVYLGGEITGEQQDGLYTSMAAYTPGRQLMHGGGVAEQRMTIPGGFVWGGIPGAGDPGRKRSEGERPEGVPEGDFPENGMPEPPEGEMPEFPAEGAPEKPEGDARGWRWHDDGQRGAFGNGRGGPRGMESSAEIATGDFLLTRQSNTFSNLTVAE